MSWLAALAGRVAFFSHRAWGHDVSWRAASIGRERGECPGDIVCHDCREILWCRAHDPWRGALAGDTTDHWGVPDVSGDAIRKLARHPR